MEIFDPLSPDHPLPTLLRRRARSDADRVFVRDLGNDLTVSYGEFDRIVDRWAGRLLALGVRPGEAIVTVLPNGVDAVALWPGATRAGGVEVPLNPAYRGRLMTHMIANAGARVVVTCQRFLPQLLDLIGDLPTLEAVVLTDGVPNGASSERVSLHAADAIEPVDLDDATVAAAPWDLSCILYTSGTTGPSKGVMVTWAQALMTVTGCFPPDGLGPDDHWYVPYPLFHMSGKLCVYGAALYGSELVIREKFSLSRWWEDIDEHRCTTALMIGSVPQLVAGRPRESGDADHTLRNVEMAPMPENARELAERFGLRLSTVFNMTEISCPVMTGWGPTRPGSVGRLRPGYEVRIVDAHDRELPDGELGEITVRSSIPWVLNVGYWGMPDKTAEAWRNGWFHTGDAGYRDEDGYFYFVDRIKDAIRRGGENISSMELEAEIADHPAVRECAAIGVPSELGEEDVLVYLVPEADGCDPADVHRFCQERLPKFMVPRYLTILDQLPKTPTEKIRKGVLKDAWREREIWDAQATQVPSAG